MVYRHPINPIKTECDHVYYQPEDWHEYATLRLEEGKDVICKECGIETKIRHACAGYGCCCHKLFGISGISGYSGK